TLGSAEAARAPRLDRIPALRYKGHIIPAFAPAAALLAAMLLSPVPDETSVTKCLYQGAVQKGTIEIGPGNSATTTFGTQVSTWTKSGPLYYDGQGNTMSIGYPPTPRTSWSSARSTRTLAATT